MEVDKEFARIFQESQMVSSMLACLLYYVSEKVSSHNLLRNAIQKKNIDFKEREDLKNRRLLEFILNLHDQIEDLKEQLFREEEIKQYEDDELLHELRKQGYIDNG